MLEIIILSLVLSVFGATVHHILGRRLVTIGAGGGVAAAWTPENRLRRVRTDIDESVPGPAWASFPRAF
ncbi:hypothetical protein [Azospirillum sp. TSO22-1]|uniref:hypothetical protein n=1 Tax=Azospirillum sp. TSO22-1 TaxID=716789 RepID=UPI000D6210B9|nr:hypothetical protein [Azospirillum sp. TSO22-1]PWC31662.1 hypothetical protein TSO221_33345 [Azospirillum sp. TSO22-1]